MSEPDESGCGCGCILWPVIIGLLIWIIVLLKGLSNG